MKIMADDWHFRGVFEGTLVVDLFLGNGQHALLEANPMCNRSAVNGEIPEVIIFCEMPGERLESNPGTGRWLTRPPNRQCPWSNVELPQALWMQLQTRVNLATDLAAGAAEVEVRAAGPTRTALKWETLGFRGGQDIPETAIAQH